MSYEYSVTDEEIPHSYVGKDMKIRWYRVADLYENKHRIEPKEIMKKHKHRKLPYYLETELLPIDAWRVYTTKPQYPKDMKGNTLYDDKLLFQTYYIEDKEERRKKQMEILTEAYDDIKDELSDEYELKERKKPIHSLTEQVAISCRITEMLNDKDMTEEAFVSEMRKIYRLNKHRFTYICTIRDDESYHY